MTRERHDVDWSSVVHSDPGISGGTPVFRGTRVPAQTLFDYLEGGETVDRFLDLDAVDDACGRLGADDDSPPQCRLVGDAPQAGEVAAGDRAGALHFDRHRVADDEVDLGAVRGTPEGQGVRGPVVGEAGAQLAEDELFQGAAECRAAGFDACRVRQNVDAAAPELREASGFRN